MNITKTPQNVDIDITTHCNLRCAYCAHFSSDGDVEKDLPTAEWLQFLRELGECAVMRVTLAGGEPFLRKDFRDIIRGIVDNRMRFTILSNGTLITDETAAFLASTGRCDTVQVSIDGAAARSHDAFRGEGNFEKAVNGLKALLRNKVTPTVRVTIHKQNVHELDAIAAFLFDDIGLRGFSTNYASFEGLCRQNRDAVQLSVDEHYSAMRSLLLLNKKYENRIGAAAGPLANARSWAEMERARREKLPSLPGRGTLAACGGVFSKVAVLADGSIVPCNLLSHIVLGRVNHDRLADVWRLSEALNAMRARRKIPLSEFEYCKTCDYLHYCTGGCPALAYTETGDARGPSIDSCYRRYLEMGGTLPA